MRRWRNLFTDICTLALFAAFAIPARGAETLDVRTDAEERDPYRPVRTETYTPEGTEEIRIRRTYCLSPVDDPAGIPTRDFEDHGWVYHLAEMRREETVGIDTRRITRTVTKSSDTDKMEKILKKLDAAVDVTTENGYAGTLRLDHTSVSVEAAGYATRNNAVTATRVYPDLNDADLSLIPKTIEDGGRTLTLDDVRWEEGWQTDAQSGFLRYSATATYVGTTASRYATGYTVTANYTGEVSRSDVEQITYYVDFAPVREAEPVPTPPQPEENREADPDDGTESASHDRAGQGDSGTPARDGDSTSAGGPGDTVRPVPETERSRSSPDYSGLKRTLFSGGLLITLAGAAYLANKFKNRRGGNNSP